MKITRSKKIGIVLFLIFVFLIVTNPKLSTFEKFSVAKTKGSSSYPIRLGYYLIFSIYEHDNEGGNKIKYIGVANNFLRINQKKYWSDESRAQLSRTCTDLMMITYSETNATTICDCYVKAVIKKYPEANFKPENTEKELEACSSSYKSTYEMEMNSTAVTKEDDNSFQFPPDPREELTIKEIFFTPYLGRGVNEVKEEFEDKTITMNKIIDGEGSVDYKIDDNLTMSFTFKNKICTLSMAIAKGQHKSTIHEKLVSECGAPILNSHISDEMDMYTYDCGIIIYEFIQSPDEAWYSSTTNTNSYNH